MYVDVVFYPVFKQTIRYDTMPNERQRNHCFVFERQKMFIDITFCCVCFCILFFFPAIVWHFINCFPIDFIQLYLISFRDYDDSKNLNFNSIQVLIWAFQSFENKLFILFIFMVHIVCVCVCVCSGYVYEIKIIFSPFHIFGNTYKSVLITINHAMIWNKEWNSSEINLIPSVLRVSWQPKANPNISHM